MHTMASECFWVCMQEFIVGRSAKPLGPNDSSNLDPFLCLFGSATATLGFL